MAGAAPGSKTRGSGLHPLVPVLLLGVSLGIAFPIALWFYWPVGWSGLDVQAHPIGRDFINIWAGVRLALKGHVLQLYDIDAYQSWISEAFGQPLPPHLWNYPPTFLLLIWPFALPPYFVGLALYQGLSLAFFLWVALGLFPVGQRVLAGFLIALAPACFINLFTGQNGFLTAGMILLAWRLLERRPALSGLLFGLLTFKPQLGLLVPPALLLLRAWRVILIAAAVALLMAGLSVLLFGFEPWHLLATRTKAVTLNMLEGFGGFYMYMYMSVFYGLRVSGVPVALAWALQAITALVVAGLSLWLLTRTSTIERRLPLLISASTLITPYLFDYDLTALSAIAVWRMMDREDKPLWVRSAYVAVWISPFITFFANAYWIGLSPLFLILAFAAACCEALGEGRTAIHEKTAC